MPTSTSAFSVKGNFRLEFSVNIVGWEQNPPTHPFAPGAWLGIHQIVVGIRRMSGTDADSGTGNVSVGWGSGGSSAPFTYNFAGTDYVEIVRDRWTRSVGEDNDWSAIVDTTTTLGSAGATVLDVVVPPPSQATVPSFTPEVFTAGNNISISWSAVNPAYTHDLLYTFGALTNVTIDEGLPASSSGYLFAPSTSLVSQIPNAPQGQFTVTLVTKNGPIEVGRQSFTGTLLVPSSQAPTVNSYTVSDANSAVATQVGKFVQGLSKIRLDSVDATAKAGATIVNTRLTVEGLDLRVADTKQLLTSGTVPLLARAWDSRGLSASSSGSIDVLPYNAPTVTGLAVERTDAAGTPLETGAYLKVSATATAKSLINGSETNSLTVKVETRPYGTSTWTVRNTITPGTLTYNTPFIITGGAIFDNNGSYDVRYTASDKFNNTVVIQTVATGNVTVDLVGSGVGVGRLWTRGALDVGGDGYYTGTLFLDGTGGLAGITAPRARQLIPMTDATRTALTGASLFEGLRVRTTNNGLYSWVYTGGAWQLEAGQVLAQTESSTSVTGGAGTIVGSIVSTIALPIGQQVKVSACYSQYSTAVVPSNVVLQSRNNATNVSFATYDKRTGTRGYSTAASQVQNSSTPFHFLTTTVAAKVSAAIYLNSASCGVFGGDNILLCIESA